MVVNNKYEKEFYRLQTYDTLHPKNNQIIEKQLVKKNGELVDGYVRKNNQVMTFDKYKKQRKRSCALNDHPSKYFFSPTYHNNTKLVTISNNNNNNNNGNNQVLKKSPKKRQNKTKKGSRNNNGKKQVRKNIDIKIKKTRRKKIQRKNKGKRKGKND